jgi:hypothetical protein
MEREALFDVDNGPIERLFQTWQSAFGKPRARLDHKRQQRLRWALLNYTEEECEQAIIGCSHSPFHNGQNPRGKKYVDLELIFRDSSHVEDFIEIYHGNLEENKKLKAWLSE